MFPGFLHMMHNPEEHFPPSVKTLSMSQSDFNIDVDIRNYNNSNSKLKVRSKLYDDKRDDKFTVFRSRWESIRAHSKKLMGIYRQRINGEPTLENWIESLCGGNTIEESLKFIESGNSVYATNCYKLSNDDDICYGDKIRSIIKKYNLHGNTINL